MSNELVVDLDLAIQHGLTEEEYRRVLSTLGRVPTYTELGIYSVMWSEHCSYKNSIAVLKGLPRKGEKILVEAGEENAGLVDIGDGLAIAFKIESHNHPSAIEPFQGAATGVGGILRDIFTMGARPFAVLNSLRFGLPEEQRNLYLCTDVVRGIGYYGNCFGVPTVGGEVYFDRSYDSNPLVNAMAIGVVDKAKVIRAVAQGIGNSVLLVGSATGRDGIHGATFASAELTSDSGERRPSVQVGDPFTEKCLLEALLEAQDAKCLVGVQDMGAAGIACSTTEMSARGGCGMEINLDRVPTREDGMTPYEIVLSESQERMLVITRPEDVSELKSIFEKWDLSSTQIGTVLSEEVTRFTFHGKTVAEVPPKSLSAGHGAPVYGRETKKPGYLEVTSKFRPESILPPGDLNAVFLRLLESPNIGSKAWIFQQYDNAVMDGTVVGPGSDSAVLQIPGTQKLIAATTDCNSRYVYLNPRLGGSIAVAEAARNLICSGAKPLAITNCLNFGNPYDPEVYWQFTESVAGIADGCIALETPVTGGNVSFYNEGPTGAIFPTPVIGMIGIIANNKSVLTPGFKEGGDLILLVGRCIGSIGGSEYTRLMMGDITGLTPAIDLEFERRLQTAVLRAIELDLIRSAHDLSEGGLAIGLVECCIFNPELPIGAHVSIASDLREDFLLFGEDQSRFLLSYEPKHENEIIDLMREFRIPVATIGTVGGRTLEINRSIKLDLKTLTDKYSYPIKPSSYL